MKPTYEDIMAFMKSYFDAYNAYAQNPATVEKMRDYYTPDIAFVPYISVFGGPRNVVNGVDTFFHWFVDHPWNYEQFEVERIAVDERQMIAVALLKVTLFDSKTNEVLLTKHYMPMYELAPYGEGEPRIKKILFFWESSPPETDAKYRAGDLGI
jgi:hypothetical protein